MGTTNLPEPSPPLSVAAGFSLRRHRLESWRTLGQQPGIIKLRLLQDLSRTHGFDLSQAYAYGDHIQDSYLFRSIGHPVAVNPSWRLKRRARKHRWPIRYFTL